MKKHAFFLSALILALCLAALPACAEGYTLGEPMADFSAETITGETFTLSEALKEKDLVLINLWATWCGPCRMEFPFMEEAWQAYQDRVAIIALSVEPNDTVEKLTAFAEENSLTFPIAREEKLGFGALYAYEGIPTTLIVDRFGNLVFREVGAQTSASAFTNLFDYYLRDDYAESQVLEGTPPHLPTVEPTDEALLSAAGNAEGSSLTFYNPADPYVWPMMIEEEKGGRSSLVSSNWGESQSESMVIVDVAAGEGDALAFEFYTSTEAACDLLNITIDGRLRKSFGGEHAWTQWAIPLTEGPHEVVFSYQKDMLESAGEDLARIDNVRLVSGQEAEALLAALPVYPTADEFTLTVTNEDAREIVFDDPAGAMDLYFAAQSYWIVPSGRADAVGTITADMDPEAALFWNASDGTMTALTDSLTDDGMYAASAVIDTLDTTGNPYTGLIIYPSVSASPEDWRCVVLFADEDNANALVGMLDDAGVEVAWRYADGDVPEAEAAVSEEPMGFTVSFVDQNGAPVPGCIINFCTDETCTPVIADENGVAVFEGEAIEYHLQVIRVPGGYEFDTTQEFRAEGPGGELSFTITKK